LFYSCLVFLLLIFLRVGASSLPPALALLFLFSLDFLPATCSELSSGLLRHLVSWPYFKIPRFLKYAPGQSSHIAPRGNGWLRDGSQQAPALGEFFSA
jgi:hypothetical protein